MSYADPERARKLRKRHMHERQAVIFGVLLAFLALVFVTAAAIYTGKLELPWVTRDFTSEPTPSVTRIPVPCPPVGALPVAAADITVNVYNGAGITGLAKTTAEGLAERGFVVATTANSVTSYSGTARINFGYTGIAQAYTIAAQIDNAELQVDSRYDSSVDITLGETFLALKATENVVLDPAVPLTGKTGCIPYESLPGVPIPSVTPSVPADPAAAPPA